MDYGCGWSAKMLGKLFLALAALALLGNAAQNGGQRWPFISDDHGSTIQWIGSHHKLLREATYTMLAMKGLTPDLVTIPEPEPRSCADCMWIIRTIRTAIRLGMTFEEIRPIAIGVCLGILPPIAAEEICAGIVDNYGPHVIYIIDTAEETVEEMCIFYGQCPPPEGAIPEHHIKTHLPNTLKHVLKESKQSLHPRLKRPAAKPLNKNTLKVAHLSDIHVDFLYAEGAAVDCGLPICCRDEWPGEGSARRWGEYVCNSPGWAMDLFLDKVGEIQPDIILYTGDDPARTIWEDTKESHLNTTNWIAQTIAKRIPGVPTFPVIGNHDIWPSNMYYMPRFDGVVQEMNQAFHDLWSTLAGFTAEQEETILKSGYYTILARPGLRVITINTNYGEPENWYSILFKDETDYPEMKRFIESTLQQARDNGEKVMFLAHHPSDGTWYDLSYFLESMYIEYSDIIVLNLAGHTHFDTFQVAVDEQTGEAKGVQYVGPSMQPDLYGNPGFRVFYLDAETFQPLDWQLYYFNIDTAEGENPPVELLYQATIEYGVADVSPQAMLDLSHRFEDDDELFQTYTANKLTKSPYVTPCTGDCKLASICDTRTITSITFQECMDGAQQPHSEKALQPVTGGSPGFNKSLMAFCWIILFHIGMV